MSWGLFSKKTFSFNKDSRAGVSWEFCKIFKNIWKRLQGPANVNKHLKGSTSEE